jgi:hypothetical protein
VEWEGLRPRLLATEGAWTVRKAVAALGFALGLFLVIRAVAEPFVIDLSDPATYRNDWGGPSLLGSCWFTADRAWWQPSPS